MTDIFISYRRQDAAADAGRLYEDLLQRAAGQTIFMDLEGIPPGVDFRESLKDNVRSASTVLVLIGPRWLDLKNDATGQRRLDEEIDYVRFEIETALRLNKRVIQVLLPGAQMPSAGQLPESISDLAYCNAYQVAYKFWQLHVDELTKSLPGKWVSAADLSRPKPTWKTWATLLGIGIPLLTVLHVAVVWSGLSIDPQLLLAGAAIMLGVLGNRLNFSIPQNAIAGLEIAVATGLLASVAVGMLYGQPLLAGNMGEAMNLIVFIGFLLVAYLIGALLIPVFNVAVKSRRNRS